MAARSPTPLVSVLIPVRFGRYLTPALDSILKQTEVDFEVVCIEDRADASVSDILNAVSAREPRLRAIRNSGSGIADALNAGLTTARGPLVARMDADDIAMPFRLATQARHLELHPEIGVLGTQAVAIDADGKETGKARVPVGAHRVRAALQSSAPLIHPTVMMRRHLLVQVGGYRRLFEGAEDYDLWLRLSAHTNLDNLAAAFLLLRRHPDQVTIRKQFRQARLAALALVSHNLRESTGHDAVSDLPDLRGWRAAIGASCRTAPDDVRELTATRLADNGGTLRQSGARYLQQACRRAMIRRSPDLGPRMALACVRHEIQLFRADRSAEAVRALLLDLLRWRARLIFAYARHISILWRARRSVWRTS